MQALVKPARGTRFGPGGAAAAGAAREHNVVVTNPEDRRLRDRRSYLRLGRLGREPSPSALIIGHEFMGVVEEVGTAVEDIKPGDIVSGEGHIGCGHCFFCRTGQGHICREMTIIGVDRDGCFANYFCFPATNVWKVAPAIPPEVAAIFDPFGNAMHTVMAQSVAGKSVAVVGVGSIGLMACKIASVAGALVSHRH